MLWYGVVWSGMAWNGVVYAQVNNAGMSAGHLVDLTSLADYELVMRINFFAGVALTKGLRR